jgi:hypothetical protein
MFYSLLLLLYLLGTLSKLIPSLKISLVNSIELKLLILLLYYELFKADFIDKRVDRVISPFLRLYIISISLVLSSYYLGLKLIFYILGNLSYT